MYCRNCGNELPEGANFCPACGTGNDAEVVAETPVAQAPAEIAEEAAVAEMPADDVALETEINAGIYSAQMQQEENSSAKDELSGSILTFGILSLVFAETGIVGLIMAIIARRKIASFVEQFGETSGRASVGKGLSTGGFIASIVMTVLWAVYFSIIALVVVVSML